MTSPDSSLTAQSTPKPTGSDGPSCAGATGWPGLIFWLGEGIFRTLGYFALVLGGICIARKDSLGVLIFEILVGHVLICAAEVIDQMNDERKRDSSANTKV